MRGRRSGYSRPEPAANTPSVYDCAAAFAEDTRGPPPPPTASAVINVVIPVVYQGLDAHVSAARTADTAAYLRRALASLEPAKKKRRVGETGSSSDAGLAGVAIAIAEGATPPGEDMEVLQDADNEDVITQITGMLSSHQIGPASAVPNVQTGLVAGARPMCPANIPPELYTWLGATVSISYARRLEAYVYGQHLVGIYGQEPDATGIGRPMVPPANANAFCYAPSSMAIGIAALPMPDGDDRMGQTVIDIAAAPGASGEVKPPVLASVMAQGIIDSVTAGLPSAMDHAADAGGTRTVGTIPAAAEHGAGANVPASSTVT